jgi:hypothetical protein
MEVSTVLIIMSTSAKTPGIIKSLLLSVGLYQTLGCISRGVKGLIPFFYISSAESSSALFVMILSRYDLTMVA